MGAGEGIGGEGFVVIFGGFVILWFSIIPQFICLFLMVIKKYRTWFQCFLSVLLILIGLPAVIFCLTAHRVPPLSLIVLSSAPLIIGILGLFDWKRKKPKQLANY